MAPSDIVLERETANDETAVVVKVYVASGTTIAKDQPVFDIENSKATQEVRSPGDGILVHTLKVGDNVCFGVPIAKVMSSAEVPHGDKPVASNVVQRLPATAFPPSHAAPQAHKQAGLEEAAASVSLPRPPKFSKAAAALVARTNLDARSFTVEFVTTADVHAQLVSVDALAAALPLQSRLGVAHARPGAQAVSGRKRAEIASLSAGAGATMLSVLGVSLGPITVRRDEADVFSGRITDLVIYEASRLMKKYPKLNSFFADGHVCEHERVVAGLALDEGGRLVVYGIENASQLGLSQLRAVIADAIARYLENSLTATEMSRATFTVTDLSGAELDFILPLLPAGQSCIIGITRSDATGFHLFAGFDHRVTEGREVAAFLGELRSRLLSFAELGTAVDPTCFFCGKFVSEEIRTFKRKGLMKLVHAQGQEVYCCAACWSDW
jgi:pyruvate/2-oxoglutarate dehydrogenase complex dihydrolipoamide acyltransferase (E2) component